MQTSQSPNLHDPATRRPQADRVRASAATGRAKASAKSLDPKLPKGRKTFISTVVSSLIAVAVVLFAKGDLPQINQFFAAANELVQSHNDDVVQGLIHYGPFLLLGFGVVVGGAMLAGSWKARKSA